MSVPDIVESTKRYEAWLGRHVCVVGPDLVAKHRAMAESAFGFLRATFYRWAQRWPTVCADLASAPAVLAVGDIHIENFGTWRDAEGRLVWGVNDFDEATRIPYANDLVRLATSVGVAVGEQTMAISLNQACDAIVAGYQSGLAAKGGPFILAEHHLHLRRLAVARLAEPEKFWAKLDALAPTTTPHPPGVVAALEATLPEPGLEYQLRDRVAGLGSLGHPRVVALSLWRGGKIAREAKALVPSAWVWADADADRNGPGPKVEYAEILTAAVRCPDPFVWVGSPWLVRRLAPDCRRIELADLPQARDEARLVRQMGWELANIHLGSPDVIPSVERDLAARPAAWLQQAAAAGLESVRADWKEWRHHTAGELR